MAGQLHEILDSILLTLREISGKKRRGICLEDKLQSVMVRGSLQGALQSTVILLESNIETDRLKVLRMNILVLQYRRESAAVILKPWCAVKLVEEQ